MNMVTFYFIFFLQTCSAIISPISSYVFPVCSIACVNLLEPVQTNKGAIALEVQEVHRGGGGRNGSDKEGGKKRESGVERRRFTRKAIVMGQERKVTDGEGRGGVEEIGRNGG